MDIYAEAIEVFGKEIQLIKAVEELSELQKEICKFLISRTGNVEEEIADVKIMIKQLEKIFDKKSIDKWESEKINRFGMVIQVVRASE
ncbi:hypothetical protein SAMN02745883_00714 [Caminicella sporogenes DSM 14501]|uniref:Uncharacterized protein n=1 Tax=Caminicella sporogenes DSM 14501 TaxID=1121266 RepID=A0A1M6MZ22_9FIRM|nr:hypothetical protein [Caminicella sporogenes]SHJ88688.1 hypothetical protein SAMN02745883_00714 [Caminicella sporogenes DSM 14501]